MPIPNTPPDAELLKSSEKGLLARQVDLLLQINGLTSPQTQGLYDEHKTSKGYLCDIVQLLNYLKENPTSSLVGSEGGNGAADSGKAALFDGSGGLTVTNLIRALVEGGTHGEGGILYDAGLQIKHGANSSVSIEVQETPNSGDKILKLRSINGTLATISAIKNKTASHTLDISDRGQMIEMEVAGANNLTVPPNADVAFAIGEEIEIVQYGAGQTTIVAGSGVTIRSAGGALKLSGQYSSAALKKRGTNEWYLVGDITT